MSTTAVDTDLRPAPPRASLLSGSRASGGYRKHSNRSSRCMRSDHSQIRTGASVARAVCSGSHSERHKLQGKSSEVLMDYRILAPGWACRQGCFDWSNACTQRSAFESLSLEAACVQPFLGYPVAHPHRQSRQELDKRKLSSDPCCVAMTSVELSIERLKQSVEKYAATGTPKPVEEDPALIASLFPAPGIKSADRCTQPSSRENLYRRLYTYKVGTWFCKPEVCLDPVQSMETQICSARSSREPPSGTSQPAKFAGRRASGLCSAWLDQYKSRPDQL